MKYTAVIRTLGTAGDKYQQLLDSLDRQTIKPSEIIVYIAEGYNLPKETIGKERYVYVKKGMVAQRALRYDEVKTEYILFLDDDVFLPPTAVATLYNELNEMRGDVISPCVFYNHKASLKSKIIKTITGKEVCGLWGKSWAYKVLPTAGFSYLNTPKQRVYKSQSNAGPCFFCKKENFLKIEYHEEMWLDETPYALPDDQVMFYKMHLMGLKVLTSFDSGIVHLDAGSTTANTSDRMAKLIYSEYRNKLIFWYKFIYKSTKYWKLVSIIGILYAYVVQGVKYMVLNRKYSSAFYEGVKDAWQYIKTI